MKLDYLAKTPMKQVNFHGIELEVPEHITHIAVNSDMSVIGYLFEPEINLRSGEWDDYAVGEYLGKVILAGNESWKDTLVEV